MTITTNTYYGSLLLSSGGGSGISINRENNMATYTNSGFMRTNEFKRIFPGCKIELNNYRWEYMIHFDGKGKDVPCDCFENSDQLRVIEQVLHNLGYTKERGAEIQRGWDEQERISALRRKRKEEAEMHSRLLLNPKPKGPENVPMIVKKEGALAKFCKMLPKSRREREMRMFEEKK